MHLWGPMSMDQRVCKKRVSIYGNDASAKTLSNLSLWLPEYGMTAIVCVGFPCQQLTRGSENGASY